MFELFKSPRIDFMGKRAIWLSLSAILVLGSLVVLPTYGIKRGIELGGGAELQVRYAEAPDLGAIRSALAGAGFESHLVTTIGPPADNEVYIRIGLPPEAQDEDITPRVAEALKNDDMRSKAARGLLNLNTADQSTVEAFLLGSPALGKEQAAASALAIADARRERAIFRGVGDLRSVPGVAPAAIDDLEARAFAGPFAFRGQSYIGPAVGREIVQKAIWAILGSLGGMLVYIWIRFQLEWGVAAVIALVHDTIITLGLFALFEFEMSLPVVASFLTLIGYSVNDKVVVFDRMRENIKTHGYSDLLKLINDSMNQALSRTILTSSLTWLATIALFTLGGQALKDFSFPLMIGIVVGTYSSIYIAAPVLLLWQHFFGSKRLLLDTSPAPATQRPAARKVRKAPR